MDDTVNTEFTSDATAEDIFYCFRLILGRIPSSKEWTGHVSRVGDPLDDVVATYLNSLEFHDRGLLKQQATQNFGFVELDGFGMYASPDDIAVGKHLLYLRDYEPHVSRPFRSVLKPGMRVLDIGANIGFYSLLAASRTGANGEVWAIEPNPANIRLILSSKAKNNFTNIRIVQAAAHDKWEPLSLFIDSSNGAVGAVPAEVGEAGGRTVMGLPLRDVLRGARLDVVKIDVEGAEGRAIAGMIDEIATWKPIVFSEFTPDSMPAMSGMSPEEYLQMFTSLGYCVSVLDKDAGRIDCGGDSHRVMKAFELATDSHIDLMFEHGAR